MAERRYRISGRVVERSGRAVPGARVEVWDRDTRYHDLLGVANVDAEGRFAIDFDETYFGDYAPDRMPDVFFKVFLDQREVKNTFAEPMHNLRDGQTDVTLELDLGEVRPAGRDYLQSEQMFKVLSFVRQSDLPGVYRDGRAKVQTVGAFAGALGMRALTAFDFQPVRTRGVLTDEVVGQDLQTARVNLAKNEVAVSDVRPFDARADVAGIKAIADFPVALKKDDQVILYEEQGKVRYYSLVRKTPASSVDAATVARLDGEVANLKSNVLQVATVREELETVKASSRESSAQLAGELADVKTQVEEVTRLKQALRSVEQASADKDVQIRRLEGEVKTLRDTQADFTARFSPEKLNVLEGQLRALDARIGNFTPARPIGEELAPARPIGEELAPRRVAGEAPTPAPRGTPRTKRTRKKTTTPDK